MQVAVACGSSQQPREASLWSSLPLLYLEPTNATITTNPQKAWSASFFLMSTATGCQKGRVGELGFALSYSAAGTALV